jgi:hypothetical protein
MVSDTVLQGINIKIHSICSNKHVIFITSQECNLLVWLLIPMTVARTWPALQNSGIRLVLWQKVVPAEVLTHYDWILHWHMLKVMSGSVQCNCILWSVPDCPTLHHTTLKHNVMSCPMVMNVLLFMVRLAEEVLTVWSYTLLQQPEQICFFLPPSLISIYYNSFLPHKTKS